MSGHFTILSSPECIDIHDEIQRRESLNYNLEIKNDCILMYNYLQSCNLLPSPYTVEHGILATNNYNPEIHLKEQFLKEIRILANISNVPASWDVVIYYIGHSYKGSGNWAIENDEEITFDDVIQTWMDGVNNTCSKNLTLVLDCSQAGYWIEKLQQSQYQQYHIAIIAATNNTTTNQSIAISQNFVYNWINNYSIPIPQIPMSYATISYNSIKFTSMLTNCIPNHNNI